MNIHRDVAEGVKEGQECAALQGCFEHIIGYMEGIVVENGKYPQMKVGDVEGGRSYEDFCGGWVFEGSEQRFM
jgi:hypothetical protein